jgi:hypothetical protein
MIWKQGAYRVDLYANGPLKALHEKVILAGGVVRTSTEEPLANPCL